MKKRLLAAIIAVMMIASLFPVSVLADSNTITELKVNCINMTVGKSAKVGGGTAELTWDDTESCAVLTLTDAVITLFEKVSTEDDMSYCAGIYYVGEPTLKIVCKGSCSIEGPSFTLIKSKIYEGIYSKGNVVVSGSLAFKNVDMAFDCYDEYGDVGTMNTENADITVNCNIIAAMCGMNLKNTTMDISTSSIAALACEGSLDLESSTLNVEFDPEDAVDYEGAVAIYAALINGDAASAINLNMNCDIGRYRGDTEICFVGIAADNMTGNYRIKSVLNVESNEHISAVGIAGTKTQFTGILDSAVNFKGEHLSSASVAFERAVMVDYDDANRSQVKAVLSGANADDIAFSVTYTYPQVLIDYLYAYTDNPDGVAVIAGKDAFTDWFEQVSPVIMLPAEGQLTLVDSKSKLYTVTDTEGNPASFVVISTGSIFEDTYNLVPAFRDSIEWVYAKGITSGTDATHYNPYGTCTRAHVVTFLWRAAGCPEPINTVNSFSDVVEGSYYYKAVLWAAENGITSGYDDGTFRPGLACTRAQVVTFLWRYMGQPTPTMDNPFVDIDMNGYYTAILWAAESGITSGTDATHFNPYGVCHRAHIATFLYRCMGK